MYTNNNNIQNQNNKLNNNKDRLYNLFRLLGKPDQIFENKTQKLDFIYKDVENLFKIISFSSAVVLP